MSYLDSMILGLVQGVTEWLPISSSGHLYLAQHFLGLEGDLSLMIWLHGATLLAVFFVFSSDIKRLLLSLLYAGKGHKNPYLSDFILGCKLMLATLVTAIGALFFEPIVQTSLSTDLVAWTLLLTSGLVGFSVLKKSSRFSTDFSWILALFLGAVQVLAIIPGLSRSGVTLVFLLLVGLAWREAVKISFLLAIPTILGAMVFDSLDANSEVFSLDLTTLIAMMTAFLAGWITIVLMKHRVEKHWWLFAVYCGLLGVGLLTFEYLI